MMNTDSIYKYVGLFIVSLFVIYIVLRTLNFQAKIIEGMATGTSTTDTPNDKDKIAAAIASNTTFAEDSLLISKYQKSYEDIIINLENNINFFMLGAIINSGETISKKPMDPASIALINSINSLKAYKDTLNDAMTFLDKTSGSTSSDSSSGSGDKSSNMFSF
jgi:hypothetical protein